MSQVVRIERTFAASPEAVFDAIADASTYPEWWKPVYRAVAGDENETRHLFNRERFARMKRTAWLINVGRGAVVQEEALVEALAERRIAGAMLDVYEHYRLEPGHPLLALDNVVLTPHLAGMTVESRSRVSQLAVEEMLRMLGGEAPRNFVNPEAHAPQKA